MADGATKREALGYKELVIQVRPDMEFRELVKQLEQVLTLPELPDFRGCAPCLSGLDRFVLQSRILERF